MKKLMLLLLVIAIVAMAFPVSAGTLVDNTYCWNDTTIDGGIYNIADNPPRGIIIINGSNCHLNITGVIAIEQLSTVAQPTFILNNETATNIEVYGREAELHGWAYGMDFNTTQDVVVYADSYQKLLINNSNTAGIYIKKSQDVNISDTYFTTMQQVGILLNNDLPRTNKLYVHNNEFYENMIGIQGDYGIYNITIHNNFVNMSSMAMAGATGIMMQGEATTKINFANITNNTFHGGDMLGIAGISIDAIGTDNSTIHNNTLINTMGIAVRTSSTRVNVTSNNISGSANIGIDIIQDVNDVLVRDNTISSPTGYGLDIYQSMNVYAHNNTVSSPVAIVNYGVYIYDSNNTLLNATTVINLNGIAINASNDINTSFNNVSGSPSDGWAVWNTDNWISHNDISRTNVIGLNIVGGNTHDIYDFVSYGHTSDNIRVQNSAYTSLVRAESYDAGGHGVNLNSILLGFSIINSTIRNNTQTGIFGSSVFGGNMTDNNIYGNAADNVNLLNSHDNIIVGGKIHNGSSDGIEITSGRNNTVRSITIADNANEGIYSAVSDYTKVEYSDIYENACIGVDFSTNNNSYVYTSTIHNNSGAEVWVEYSDNINITGNIISDTRGYSIPKFGGTVSFGVLYTDSNGLIWGNTIGDVDNGGSSLSAGIYSDESVIGVQEVNVTIAENAVYNNSISHGFGILLAGNSTYNITNNSIYNCTYGIAPVTGGFEAAEFYQNTIYASTNASILASSLNWTLPFVPARQSTGATFWDTVINTPVSGSDIRTLNASYINMVNASYNRNNLWIHHSANITDWWYVRARVIDADTGLGISNATVNSTDVNGTFEWSQLATNGTGYTNIYPNRELRFYWTGTISNYTYNPHNFNAVATGYDAGVNISSITTNDVSTRIIRLDASAISGNETSKYSMGIVRGMSGMFVALLAAMLLVVVIAILMGKAENIDPVLFIVFMIVITVAIIVLFWIGVNVA